MRLATRRPTMSVVAPAGKGTMILIGLFGKACASALPAHAASAAHSTARASLFVIVWFLLLRVRAFYPNRPGLSASPGALRDNRATLIREDPNERPSAALPRQPPRQVAFRAARPAQLLRVPRPRHRARDARQGRRTRHPCPAGEGAARRVALTRLQRAVRLRAQGLG